MPNWRRKRQERVKARDPNVAPMRFRKHGVMEPRNKPRGGAKNLKKDALNSEELNPTNDKPFYTAEEQDDRDYQDFEDSQYADYDDDWSWWKDRMKSERKD